MSKRRKPPAPVSAPPPATPAAPARRLTDVFAIDSRTLGAFRIGLGVWLLLDLVERSFDLTAHYTDGGVLSRIARIALYDHSDRKYWLSLHLMAGDPWLVRALFGVAAGVYALLAVGYRTGPMAVAAFVLDCSLQSRNPPVGHGGDDLTRVLLFWGLFLPLGGRLSLDVTLGRRPPAPDRVCNPATFALLTQVGFVYLFGAVHKRDAVWHTDLSAVYYALSADAFATSLGRALAPIHSLTQPLTFAAYLLEWGGPLLVFVPWRTPWVRLVMVTLFWGFHLGTALTLHLGLFPLAGLIAWVPFLPGRVWTRKRWLVPSVAGPGPTLGWAASVFVVAVWGYVLLWNLREVNPWWGRVLPNETNGVARLLRVDQNWQLFAPKPMTEDGWYVMEGTLEDGRVVNLWEDAPLPVGKPADVAGTYCNTRWRKLLLNLWAGDYASHRRELATWLRHRWEEKNPELPLTKVELVFMLESTPPPGEPTPAARRTSLLVAERNPAPPGSSQPPGP